jgi:hypothetical protein
VLVRELDFHCGSTLFIPIARHDGHPGHAQYTPRLD